MLLLLFILLLIACASFAFYGGKSLIEAKQIQFQKIQEEIQYKKQLEDLQSSIKDLKNQKFSLLQEIDQCKKDADAEYYATITRIQEQIEMYKDNTSYAGEQYLATLEKEYERAEQEYDAKLQQIEEDRQATEEALKKLKAALSAGVRAQLREKEKTEKINFYKIAITEADIADIEKLNNLKTTFHQPAIINKLIWTAYCQKKVTEMCNRVLGTKTVCGIYKITNLKTQQCYIGQSVNIAERWKQHCKCGCDIDASVTNKLYQDMIKTGIWNFSFELMEACPRADLNEKERLWIEMYQSDIYGLNSTKGNQ